MYSIYFTQIIYIFQKNKIKYNIINYKVNNFKILEIKCIYNYIFFYYTIKYKFYK